MKTSKGEQKVAQILSQGGFTYRKEVSFEGLKGGKDFLRFDFAVFYKGKFQFLLEVNGKQHYEYVPYFHKTQLAFRRQKEYDMRKIKYCLSHKILLICIPYWELENLTLNKILTYEDFRAKTPQHNINLIKRR